MATIVSCYPAGEPFRVYAWMSCKIDMPEERLDSIFSNAARAGTSGICFFSLEAFFRLIAAVFAKLAQQYQPHTHCEAYSFAPRAVIGGSRKDAVARRL